MAYPDDFTTFREIENKPGQVYDSNKKTTIFKEDFVALQNAVARIEHVLGLNPEGAFDNVSDRIAELEP